MPVQFLRKLIISDLKEKPLGHTVLNHQWENVLKIWKNEGEGKSGAIGVERFLKLFLILSQFVFPSIYIRHLFGKKGLLHKNLGVEFHVILKLILSIVILYFGIYNLHFSFFGIKIIYLWCFYMILETITYTGNLVFSEEVFSNPISHKRNLILIIIDYITLNLDFGNLYLITKSLQENTKGGMQLITTAHDAVYFSIISSLTIGYGDITPTSDGRSLVTFHSITMLLFGVLFLNFYLSRINTKQNEK